MTLTIQDIFRNDKVETLPPNQSTLTVHLKDGFDGSGNHSIFNQKGSERSSNIIIYEFMVLKITDEEGTVIYKEPLPNTPKASRPLMLLLGKTTQTNTKKGK